MASDDEDDPEDEDEVQPVKAKDATSKGRVKKNVLRSNPASPGSPSRPSSPTLPENKGAQTGSQQVGNSDPSPPPSPSATGVDAGVSNPGKLTKEENVRRNIELIRNLSRVGSAITGTAENEDDEVFILSQYYNLKLIKDKNNIQYIKWLIISFYD